MERVFWLPVGFHPAFISRPHIISSFHLLTHTVAQSINSTQKFTMKCIAEWWTNHCYQLHRHQLLSLSVVLPQTPSRTWLLCVTACNINSNMHNNSIYSATSTVITALFNKQTCLANYTFNYSVGQNKQLPKLIWIALFEAPLCS